MMDEQQTKLKAVLTNVLNQTIVLNEQQKTAIIKYVKEEGNIPNTQICINCLKVALQRWEHEGPMKQPLMFYMDILIEFSKNKGIFVLLHQNNILKRFFLVFQATDYTKDCDIFRRYIKLLDAFTYNEYGRNWLVDSWECWKTVFNVIGTQKYTEDLSVFLTDLFLSVVDTSELFSLELSRLILKPLTVVCINISQNNLSAILEEDLYYDIIPTLNLMSSVIMRISETVKLNNQWLKHCNKLLGFQKPLSILLEIAKGKEIILELSRLQSGLYFLEITQNSNKHQDYIKSFFNNTMKIMDLNITHSFVENTIILAHNLQHYWYHINRLFDVTKIDLPSHFDLFMCIYQISTFIGTCKKMLGPQMYQIVEKDKLRHNYVEDLIKKIGKSMMGHFGKIRKYILGKPSFLPEMHLALNYICKSVSVHSKECRIIMFNALLYTLEDIVSDIHRNQGIRSEFYDSHVVIHFIEAFIFYGGGCGVSWKDVPSHMQALVTVTDLLEVEDLPYEVIVACLKMVDLAITKRMAPDLSLLVECNFLNSIETLLELNLNCEDDEVRCAASKVLITVSESAKTTYPFFQKILLESDLPQQLLTRIFSEAMEVRCNAVRCIQHLAQISSIWEVISPFPNLLDSLINLMKTETDNQFRAELVNLVAVIYEEEYFNELQVKELYDLLTRLGTHDCDIAVRINCLKFWNVVIKKLLVEEGMIDGEFPEVTFSKATKKIVVLNEEEIKRRLKRLMKKLSENGCLTVLNYCFFTKQMEEKQCVDEIVHDLLEILKKYHIDEANVDLSYTKSPKSKFKIFSLDDLVLEIVGTQEFLENVTQSPAGNYEHYSERNFVRVLDNILKSNKRFI